MKGVISQTCARSVETEARARPTRAANLDSVATSVTSPSRSLGCYLWPLVERLLCHLARSLSLSPLCSVSCLFCPFVRAWCRRVTSGTRTREEGFKKRRKRQTASRQQRPRRLLTWINIINSVNYRPFRMATYVADAARRDSGWVGYKRADPSARRVLHPACTECNILSSC